LVTTSSAANCADFNGHDSACEASGCEWVSYASLCADKFTTREIDAECVGTNMAPIDSEEDCSAATGYFRAEFIVAYEPDLNNPLGCSRIETEYRTLISWKAPNLVLQDKEAYPDGYDKEWAIDEGIQLVCKTKNNFPEYCSKFSDCQSCFDYDRSDSAWPTSCSWYNGEGCRDVFDSNHWNLVWRRSECPALPLQGTCVDDSSCESHCRQEPGGCCPPENQICESYSPPAGCYCCNGEIRMDDFSDFTCEPSNQFERDVASTLGNQNKRLKTVNQALKKALKAMGA